MASVYWDPAVGGDGTTLTDADMANYGHVSRFIPALSQLITVAQNAVTQATNAASSATASAASASSALGAPGTNATSTTSLTIGTGSKSLTIQTGKAYAVGQVVVIAYTTSPSNQMTGVITSYNSGTGALVVDVQQTLGSGTQSAWTVSLGALVSSTLPSQTGNNGKFLTTNGTSASWADALTPSGNLSGLSNYTTARSNLGLTIGTHVQAYDAELAAIAGLTSAADRLPYFTGSGTAALATFTSFGRSLVDDADAAAAQATLSLVPGTNVQAYNAKLAAFAGLTGAADKLAYFTGASAMAVTDLSSFMRTVLDDASAGAARSTLGAAASGPNTDITSLGGLTTPLSVAQGGTGGTDSATALASLFGAFTGKPGAIAQINTAGDGMTYKKRAKAKWTMSGTTIASQVTENCTVSRTDTGDFTITFTNAMDSADYIVTGSANRTGSGDSMIFSGNRTSANTSSAAYITLSNQGGSPDDPGVACVLIEAI